MIQLHRCLQERPGIRPRRSLIDVDMGYDRGADEKRRVLGVVVDQIDANRKPLNHLDQVARGVLGRQQRERGPGGVVKAGDASLEDTAAAVHVGSQLDRLSDTKWTPSAGRV